MESNNAAEQLDRFARMFEGIVEARDAFKKVIPLDQAVRERNDKLAQLDADIAKRESEMTAHKAEMEKQRKAAKEHMAKAQANADEMIQKAEAKAEEIMNDATLKSDAQQKAMAERLMFMQRQHEEKVSGLSLQAARAKELLDQRTQAIKETESQATEAEAKLAAARTRIAELMKA